MIRFVLRLVVVLLPWCMRRHVLARCFGYHLHPTAKIGLSWIFPERLEMGAGSCIGHFNVAIHLRRIVMGEHSRIDRSNWITGFPQLDARHFGHRSDRDPALIIGEHAAITKRHLVDCTDRIEIGRYTTVAGYSSQLMTHSIDLVECRQNAAPITIGEYCFVGTNVVVLGGARLPARSVLGAKALLNKAHAEAGWLYAGVPARPIQAIAASAKYFSRTDGFVR